MALANENYLKTPEIYYFDEIDKRVNAYRILHPSTRIISLSKGDTTLPLPQEAVKAMQKAVSELSEADTFRGYSPIRGYDFLIEKILKDYRSEGIVFDKENVFINDGAKSDLGNIGHVLGRDNIIAITDPVYPVYEKTTIMSGRAGEIYDEDKWSNIVYLTCNENNGFVPQIPEEKVDVIYLCNPGNPTGTTISRNELKRWVDYALEHQSIIVYDGAYHSYITDRNVPKSIFQIKGAKKVAVEIRSYSKTAGFTGLRCGYTVIPSELLVYTRTGEAIPLLKLWHRRNANYTNGVSYVVQRGAEAIYSKHGKMQVRERIDCYLHNANLIYNELKEAGLKVYGSKNSPYVWFGTPGGQPSWKFFQTLLYDFQIISMPGIFFGSSGEGYMRFSGFNTTENTLTALNRIKNRI